jgi:UPF0716 family protein affecting phage T7 exclusion
MENRRTLIVWAIAAVVGTVAVWWLRSYLNELTVLARTDRAAALELFRTRGLPALLGVVAIAVAAGATLMRQGLQLVNSASTAADRGSRPAPRPPAVVAGWLMASAGFVLAAVPLALASVVLWLIRRT